MSEEKKEIGGTDSLNGGNNSSNDTKNTQIGDTQQVTEQNNPNEEFIENFSWQEIVYPSTPERVEENGEIFSNSQEITIDENEESNIRQLNVLDRNLVGDKPNENNKKDMLKIAVVSLEANPRHSERFHKQFDGEKIQRVITTQNKINSVSSGQAKKEIEKSEKDFEQMKPLLKNVNYVEEQDNLADFFKQVFENKESPHVVAVTEGHRVIIEDVKTFSLTNKKGTSYNYSLSEDKLETNKAEQNMHFYVRNDMKEAITFKKEKLGDSSFSVGKISFSTKENKEDAQPKKYSALVVHLPNDLVGKEVKEKEMHKIFVNYAQENKKETVIGYMGDTNYKYHKAKNSSASIGGYFAKENAEKTSFFHTSSGDKTNYTNFMQVDSLNDQDNSFSIQQPSLLNTVNLKIEKASEEDKFRKVRTDHPSFEAYILLDAPIENRNLKYNGKKETLEAIEYEIDLLKKHKNNSVDPSKIELNKKTKNVLMQKINNDIDKAGGIENYYKAKEANGIDKYIQDKTSEVESLKKEIKDVEKKTDKKITKSKDDHDPMDVVLEEKNPLAEENESEKPQKLQNSTSNILNVLKRSHSDGVESVLKIKKTSLDRFNDFLTEGEYQECLIRIDELIDELIEFKSLDAEKIQSLMEAVTTANNKHKMDTGKADVSLNQIIKKLENLKTKFEKEELIGLEKNTEKVEQEKDKNNNKDTSYFNRFNL